MYVLVFVYIKVEFLFFITSQTIIFLHLKLFYGLEKGVAIYAWRFNTSIIYNSSCLLMPSARSVYFHSFLSTDYVIVFQLQHKEHPRSHHSLLPRLPPGIERKKRKLLSDEFFSTFLNDAAFVKTFLISGRRASKGRRGEGRGERTFAKSLIFLFQWLQQPLTPWPY